MHLLPLIQENSILASKICKIKVEQGDGILLHRSHKCNYIFPESRESVLDNNLQKNSEFIF